MSIRLPIPGGDVNQWGSILNQYLGGQLPINVKEYGALGDGLADDTAAIDAAETARAAVNGLLFFPAGNYKYNGSGLNSSQIRVSGAGVGATTITLGGSARFINVTGVLSRLSVTGIRFSGGVDVIRATFTGSNVTDLLVVEDCEFAGYTGAAISNNSSDMPYWKISRCQFVGANYTSSMGVALSGLTDACSILDCDFQKNRVHVKLRQGGNNAYIERNDFLRLDATSGSPRVDVWVVPQTTAVNAGNGLQISENKFGNENLDSSDYKILYADEDTGTGSDNGTYFPKLSADSTGFITGHRVRDNAYFGIATGTPIVYSTTPNIQGCVYGPVLLGAGQFSYIAQFRTVPTADRNNCDNIVGPLVGSAVATENVPAHPVSNGNGVFQLVDTNSLLDTRTAMPLGRPGAADPVGYVAILPTVIRSFSLVDATLANVNDVYGGIDASELTYSAAGGIVYGQFTMGNVTVGQPAWVEFDIKAGSSAALTLVRCYIQTEGGAFHLARMFDIPAAGWRRVRFLYVPRTAAGQTDIIFATNGVETGKVQIGRVRVYHAREPLNVDGAMLQLQHTGTLAGFYGVTPIARAVLATGTGKTVDNVITALQNLGLVKQS